MKRLIGLLMAASLVLSAGCASVQKPVPLSLDSLAAKPSRIGVVMSRVPQPDTQFPGASCLLCLAAANVANSSLTRYANALPSDELAVVPLQIVERLRARGIDATVIDARLDLKTLPGSPNAGGTVPPKDFRTFGARFNVDKVIVLEVAVLGFERTYSAYVPTSDPKAFLYGAGYLIDLSTNVYEWYAPIRITRAADGAWDEAPKFPGLTNAYFQALEMSKDQWLAPFAGR